MENTSLSNSEHPPQYGFPTHHPCAPTCPGLNFMVETGGIICNKSKRFLLNKKKKKPLELLVRDPSKDYFLRTKAAKLYDTKFWKD